MRAPVPAPSGPRRGPGSTGRGQPQPGLCGASASPAPCRSPPAPGTWPRAGEAAGRPAGRGGPGEQGRPQALPWRPGRPHVVSRQPDAPAQPEEESAEVPGDSDPRAGKSRAPLPTRCYACGGAAFGFFSVPPCALPAPRRGLRAAPW